MLSGRSDARACHLVFFHRARQSFFADVVIQKNL